MEGLDLVDYSKQSEMDQEFNFTPNAHSMTNIIIGCGGIGFWLGLQMAMMGFKEFVLIDNDKISASNLNRLPVPQTWLGVSKSVALRKMIRFLRPITTVHVINDKISVDTLDNFIVGNSRSLQTGIMVWDTTDDARIGKKIYEFCRNKYIMYRKIGYEGYSLGSYTQYSVWTTDDYTRGYRTSKANVISSSMAAGIGILGYGMGVNGDIDINMKTVLRSYMTQDEQLIDEDNDEED